MTDKQMPAPNAKHTQLVGLEFKINALSSQLSDARKAWKAKREEDVAPLRDELNDHKQAKARLLADVAQQWLDI